MDSPHRSCRTRSQRRAGRVAVVAGLGALALIGGCTEPDGEPVPSGSASPAATRSATSASPTASSTASQDGPGASNPDVTDTATSPAAAGQGGTDLPDSIPLPAGSEQLGESQVDGDATTLTFRLADPAATFDQLYRQMPQLGWDLLAGTSTEYSTDIASGTILARTDGMSADMLFVDDTVEIVLTRT